MYIVPRGMYTCRIKALKIKNTKICQNVIFCRNKYIILFFLYLYPVNVMYLYTQVLDIGTCELFI